MYTRDFTLTQAEIVEVRNEDDRIRFLFPHISIRFERSKNESPSKILWVAIDGPSEEICDQAKKYITALTAPETKVIIKIPEKIQKELLLNNGQLLRDIEQQNSVVIDMNVHSHSVTIQGEELEVVIAKSLIDEQLVIFKTENKDIDGLVKSIHQAFTIDDNVKNFALKLGYNENDITAAANSCAENKIKLNSDTLLEELMKQFPRKSPPNANIMTEMFQEEEFVARTVAESTSELSTSDYSDLRGIVIDGSNVAMCHGHKQFFSCRGIEIVINWFKQRGHRNIKVFVPQWRQEAPKQDCPMENQELLVKLEQEKHLVFTPSRRINGRRVVCYDDRYIVKYAVQTDSIIVSNDNFRDLQKENPKWRQFLDQHILMYSFVNDMFMPPDDPLGRSGPNLDEFLKTGSYQARICPYKNKCTYGNKCRYFHPESYGESTNSSQKQRIPLSCAAEMNAYENRQQQFQFNDNDIIARGCSIENNRESSTQRQRMPMSCAAEMNAYEQQFNQQCYDNDIIAKGGSGGDYNVDQHQHARKTQPQIYPSLNYYRSQQFQYQRQQTPSSIPQQPTHHQSHQHYYNLPTNQPPQHHPSHQWDSTQYNPPPHNPPPQQHSYTLQPSNSATTSNQQYYMLPPSNNRQHNSYPVPPHHQPHLSMMNRGYVDQMSVNTHYFPQTSISHTLQTIEPRDRQLNQDSYRPPAERCAPAPVESLPLYLRLIELFPDYSAIVRKVLLENPSERDMNVLVSYVLSEQTH